MYVILKISIIKILRKSYVAFEDNFLNVLYKQVPKKIKHFRGNHKPHIFRTLRLVIMKRPRLKNKASKTDLPSKKQNYKKQGILITKLNKQIKKNISKILIIMQNADNKFPKSLKLSDIAPVYLKNDPIDKYNFRLISIFRLISKVFEKYTFDQLRNYMNRFQNNLICGF